MKKFLVAIMFVVVLLSLCACNTGFTSEEEYELLISNQTKVETIRATFVYNAEDKAEVVGYADYVFVGKIVEYKQTLNDSASGIPKTVYSVQVIENIKGSLKLDKSIEVIKCGGLYKDRKSKAIYENDILPKKESTYVFAVWTTSNGDLIAEGMNTTLIINNSANYTEDVNYNSMHSAFENEVLFERDRNTSKYED